MSDALLTLNDGVIQLSTGLYAQKILWRSLAILSSVVGSLRSFESGSVRRGLIRIKFHGSGDWFRKSSRLKLIPLAIQTRLALFRVVERENGFPDHGGSFDSRWNLT